VVTHTIDVVRQPGRVIRGRTSASLDDWLVSIVQPRIKESIIKVACGEDDGWMPPELGG